MLRRPATTSFAFLLALLAVSFAVNIALGSVTIPLREVLSILLGQGSDQQAWTRIILHLRLPQAITAMLAGAALAISGLEMQTLFRNPLAGPFVLGISSGASLGVALVVLTGSSGIAALSFFAGAAGHVIAGVIGASAVLALVFVVSRRVPTLTLLILGVLFGYATSALVSILLRFSSAESVQSFVIWTQGDFSGVSWVELRWLAPLLVVGMVSGFLVLKPLNALLLGETYARTMGVEVKRCRRILIVSTALLAGGVTAYCGPIGFLGVAVPHLARSLFHSSDHRLLMPGSALLGATLALFADVIARVPGSSMVLPLSAITALIGAPVVIWVILRKPILRDVTGR
jgi:iron complex transport system permease protein